MAAQCPLLSGGDKLLRWPPSSGVDCLQACGGIGLCITHLASWCPNRSLPATHLYLTWQLAGACPPKNYLLCPSLIAGPLSFPFSPRELVCTCSHSLRGALPKAQNSQTPSNAVSSLVQFSSAPASPQTSMAQATWLCLPELGCGEHVYESPHFPLCPHCWLWALS